MAVAPYRAGQALGWLPTAAPGSSTTQLSAAANWYAQSFVADSGRTLSATRAFVSAVAGTLGASDITCDLYDSTGTGGAPGSSIETGKVPSATVTAAGWYDWTGFATALTSGQQYWLVWKNANGVPATNNCTFRVVTSALSPHLAGTAVNRMNWVQGSSTNSGSTWTTNALRSALRLAYADGSYDGLAVSNAAAGAVGDGVYSARESGVKFTSPANGVLKVLGLALLVGAKTGSPTGSPRLGLWTGSTPSLVAYTNAVPSTAVATACWVYAYFSSVQTLQPGTVTRITLGETTQSDASNNRWNNTEYTWDSDSNSLALLPWEGTAVKTYFDGTSTWTDSSGSIFGHALLLDTSGEFGVSSGAGGGGRILRSSIVGGSTL